MTIILLHTADWQIGKQFANVPGDAGAALRLQRLETVQALARLAQEQRVDVILVAGDVFEDNAVANETLRRTLNAMAPFTGDWVLLPGNHDAALAQSVWQRLRRLGIVPENVHLADRPEVIRLCEGRLEVLPAPLQCRHEIRDLTAWFDTHESPPGLFRVGLAHGAITHRLPEAAESHNPIADDRAQTARLDYLALGDWHGTLQAAPRTWYAGTPEPDRFKANDPGNVLLVTLKEPGTEPDVEKIPIARYRWESLDFEVMDAHSVAALDERLTAFGEPARTLVRLKLTGTVGFATRQWLGERLDHWQAQLHFLEVDDGSLYAQPSADDIAALGATGFIRDAIETLLAIEADLDHPDQAHAARALQILYREQMELKR